MSQWWFNLLDALIKRLGKGTYTLDRNLQGVDLLAISYQRSIELFRGFLTALFLKKSSYILFVGSRVVLKHKNKMSIGKNVYFGDNVYINALCKDGVFLGNNVSIHNQTVIDCTGVYFNLGESLKVGDNVGISAKCFIQVRGNVIIENDVIIGPGVMIFSENHNYGARDLPIRVQGVTRKDVVISEGAWLGAGCIILSGVRIGKNAIIGAGCVVTKDVGAGEVVVGVPGKSIK